MFSLYLWFKHPGHVHLLGAVRALEGVGRVDGDAAEGVVQGDEPGFALVELADELKRLILQPAGQCAHVQELFALRREFLLHLSSHHPKDEEAEERWTCSVDGHDEKLQLSPSGNVVWTVRTFTSSVRHHI